MVRAGLLYFTAGLLCRTRSLECGFLHVFVSEARNSVCPLQLRGSNRATALSSSPSLRAKAVGPLRGVILARPCTGTYATRPLDQASNAPVMPVHAPLAFHPFDVASPRAITSCRVRNASIRSRGEARRGGVIGRRSSGSRSSRDPLSPVCATRFPSPRHVLQS